MSRIDRLIRDLCPNGVPFVPLKDLVDRTSKVKWEGAESQAFQYIDLTSVDRTTHKIMETETIDAESAPSRAQQIVQSGDVLFGTTRPMLKRYCVVPEEFDGQICSTGYCVLRPQRAKLRTNFLYHLLGTAGFYAFVEANERGASYPAIPDRVVKTFQIPLPSLEVQDEIVRILDNFSALTAELEAELEARRAQYEYYRDALLNFGEFIAGGGWTQLSDLGLLYTGLSGKSKEDFTSGNARYIPYTAVHGSLRAPIAPEHFVQVKAGERQNRVQYGDVLFTASSEQPDEAGLACAVTENPAETVHLNSFCFGFRPYDVSQFHPDFTKHLFRSGPLRREISKTANGVTRFNVSKKRFMKLRVPVPAMTEQLRIAHVLDQFDALVNDLTSGLPAEIGARRKQYEYYRDRLLTFDEASS